MDELEIKIDDITGYQATPKKFDETIIFIHGLLSNSNHHIIYNASREFSNSGFRTFRYDMHKKDKSLIDLSNDLNKIVKQYNSNVTVIAHSLGSFVALFADYNKINRFVFWEPSMHPILIFDSPDKFVFDTGYKTTLPESFIDKVPSIEKTENLMKMINQQKLIVHAIGNKYSKATDFYNKIAEEKHLEKVKSDHNFTKYKDEEELYKITLDWLKK